MKVIIAGSRGITRLELVAQAIEESGFEITTVISGAARGVDTLGERWAKQRNIPVERFPANWARYGQGAGHIRNEQMAKAGDALVAIWDGASRGTRSMIDKMKRLDKPYYVKERKP